MDDQANKQVLVDVFVHEEQISLDGSWIHNVSGGKCESDARTVLISETTYAELLYRSNINFNHDYYDKLLNDCRGEKAGRYLEENRRDTPFLDEFVVEDMEHLTDIIEHDFNGEVTISKRQPTLQSKYTEQQKRKLADLKSVLTMLYTESQEDGEFAKNLVNMRIFERSLDAMIPTIQEGLETMEEWK